MSSQKTRVQTVRSARLPANVTPDVRFWRSFRQSKIIQPSSAVTHVHFNPTNNDFALTTASAVSIISTKTLERTKHISRFDEVAYSGEFRPDGRLLIAGDASGKVRIFDVASRNILVTLQPTKVATHVTKFHPTDATTFLSASEDGVARLWDLASPNPVATFEGHGNYIRSAAFIPQSNLVATGCYDSVVRVFDSRANNQSNYRPVCEFVLDEQVESVLALNSTTLACASGPSVHIFDLTSNKKIKTVTVFGQTVSCLAATPDRGILAGSLDGHVKVLDSTQPSWDVKFGWKFSGPVLCTGVSADYKHFVSGFHPGKCSVRTRKIEKPVKQTPAAAAASARPSSFSRIIRGAEYHGELEHNVLNDASKPAKKLKLYERHLNAFRWSDALDAAFAKGMTPEQTLTVLNELKTRGKVSISLSSRDEDTLEPILQWALRAVHDIRSVATVADWIGCIVDLYGGLIDRAPVLESLMADISRKVQAEINTAKDAKRIEGMLEMLM